LTQAALWRYVAPIGTAMASWSDWASWSDLKEGRIRPPKVSGVYEARLSDGEILTIGRASNLGSRVCQALVKGVLPHSAGERIRVEEDLTQVQVRWQVTEDPEGLERALHAEHLRVYGKLPKHVIRT
jgi:hypothetical protein